MHFNPLPPHGGRRVRSKALSSVHPHFNPLPPHGGRPAIAMTVPYTSNFNPLPPHGGRLLSICNTSQLFNFNPLPPHGGRLQTLHNRLWQPYFNPLPPHGGRLRRRVIEPFAVDISIHSLRMEGDLCIAVVGVCYDISIHSLRMEGDSKTAQESVFHFAYPCTILQKRMQKTTFCTRKNGFFRKKGEKFGAKPSASFCAPMIRTDTFPLNFSHRISGSSMSMVSFAPICSTFD